MAEPGLPRVEYRDERKLLIDAKREGARTFDKGILTLSAGALGLSFTLIRNQPHVSDRPLLFFAWGGFILSILAILIAQLTTQIEMTHQLKNLDRHLAGDKNAPRESAVGLVTAVLNWLSIGSFILGVTLLAVFSARGVS